jgi:hypothetical protein
MNKRRLVLTSFTTIILGTIVAIGFTQAPHPIPIEKHTPIGNRIWNKIEAYHTAKGVWPENEERLINGPFLGPQEKKFFLTTHFGKRIFEYDYSIENGPSLSMAHTPGFFSGTTVWPETPPTKPSR